MTLDEYRGQLRAIRDQYGENLGIKWGKPNMPPVLDFENAVVGWKLTWVGTFVADKFFLRLKETWIQRDGTFSREGFFSYHFGPYEDSWDLERVKATKVNARIDGQDYSGRGFHIHDGEKDRRIYQSDLRAPQLSEFTAIMFIEAAIKVRQGRSVVEAFGLELV